MTDIILQLCIIYGGSALLATLFLFLKQPVVLAYITAGIISGPSVLSLIQDSTQIEHFSHFGIILLMFLIGLDLDFRDLVKLLRKTAIVTILSSILFASLTVSILLLFGFPLLESVITGSGLMFSSTVIALKLIPTTDLHNKRIGEVMVSILLFQDILAIIVILLLAGNGEPLVTTVPLLIVKAVLLFVACYYLVKHVVFALFRRFDVIQEYVFIFSIGWCLVLAEVGGMLNLSNEIGAFIAGVTLGTSPISSIIADKLKPLREFFLILFFFSIGAQFHIDSLSSIVVPGTILAIVLVVVKPYIFAIGIKTFGEKPESALEMGVRLGQTSEFSLLVAVTAIANKQISYKTFMLIEYVVILSFILSTYWVMKNYATPISTNSKHRRD